MRELADALHLDYSTVGHIERGRRDFSIQSLIAACRYFSVSPNEMLLWETKEPVEPLETPKSASQEQIYTKTEPGNHKELFRKTKLGYVRVYLPTSPMARKDGWVFLHRAVMAEHLGRPLRPEEVVHHIDGNPGNNKLSNLMLFPNNAEHRKYHGQLKRDAEIKRLLNE